MNLKEMVADEIQQSKKRVKEKTSCSWEINLDGYWETDCGKTIWFDLTMLEKVKYCCFCGRPAYLKDCEEEERDARKSTK